MVKFKKYLAIFLASTMMLSLSACGDSSSDNDKDDESKTEQTESNNESKGSDDNSSDDTFKSASDIFEALELASTYTKGNYKLEYVINGESDGEAFDITLGSEGKIDGTNGVYGLSFDIESDGVKLDYSFDDLITTADGVAYIDVDQLVAGIVDVDTAYGAFGIPMPDTDTSYAESFQSLEFDFLKAAFDGIDVTQDGDEFTINITTADDYQKVAENVMNYINDNQSDIQSAFNDLLSGSTDSLDIVSYVQTLVDYYKDDIISALSILGYDLSEDDYDTYAGEIVEAAKESVEEAESEIEEDDLELFEDWDDIMDVFNELDWSEFQENYEEGALDTSLSVYAGEDAYKLSFDMSFDFDDTTMQVAINYEIDVDDVTVSAPENAASLTDMVSYVMNNPDVMQELAEAFNEVIAEIDDMTSLGGSSSVSIPDDYDYEEADDDGDYTLTVGGEDFTIKYDTSVLSLSEEDPEEGVAFYDMGIYSYPWDDSYSEDLVNYLVEEEGLENIDMVSTACGASFVLLYEEDGWDVYYIVTGVTETDSIISYIYYDESCGYTVAELVQALYAGI